MRGRILILSAWSVLSLLVWVLPCGDDPGDAKWGPFRGRIVDADTGEPIPGAAVVVVWMEHVPNPVQGQERFYDALAAVTDFGGRFEIPRRNPPFFSFRIAPPYQSYRAPGYVFQTEATAPDGQLIVSMRARERLSPDERFRSSPGIGILLIPEEKLKGLREAVNTKRRAMGLRPIQLPSGDFK